MRLELKIVWFAFVCFSLPFLLVGQDVEYADYDWDVIPKFEVPTLGENDSRVVIKEKTVMEYALENNAFYQYKLSHTVVYVANDLGVEWHNKMYLSAEEGADIIKQKARVINSKGQVLTFDEKDIKEGFDEQSGITFKYFALEGLDVGSFVESIHQIKSYANYNGSNIRLGSEVHKFNVDFELISAEHLIFAFASHNGLEDVVLDTVMHGKNFWRLSIADLPAFEPEDLCYTEANLPAITFKLDENTANSKKDLSSYHESVKSIYGYVYAELNKADAKALATAIRAAGIQSGMSNKEKVWQFENYVKENYAVLPYVQPEYETISALIQHKASSDNGFLKLYANAFKSMNIEHQIVLTTDRTSLRFDPDFDAACYLQSAVIYFPEMDLYLSPEASDLRLGYIPWQYAENYGLFIRRLKAGELETAIGKVQYIDAIDHNSTQLNHRIEVDMTEDVLEPNIHFKVELSGHISSVIQNIYNTLSTSERETLDEGLKQFVTVHDSGMELEVLNGEANLFGKEPMILVADLATAEFTSKAGNKVLFKVGELIGEQTEMYNEKPRQHPIDNDFNRSFYRTIKVKLPEGYTVTNPERLNVDISLEDGSAVFRSAYVIHENVLTINIDEYYNRVTYEVAEFEALKKVINAAADFNKVVLYLERN